MALWAWFGIGHDGTQRLLSRRPGAFSSIRIPMVYEDEAKARGPEAAVQAIEAGRHHASVELLPLTTPRR